MLRVVGNLIFQVNDSAIANCVRGVAGEFMKDVMNRNGITDEGLDGADRKIIEILQ